jgi:hypothetical protein
MHKPGATPFLVHQPNASFTAWSVPCVAWNYCIHRQKYVADRHSWACNLSSYIKTPAPPLIIPSFHTSRHYTSITHRSHIQLFITTTTHQYSTPRYQLPSYPPNQHNGRSYLQRVRNGIKQPPSMPGTATHAPSASRAIEIDLNVLQSSSKSYQLLWRTSTFNSPNIIIRHYTTTL